VGYSFFPEIFVPLMLTRRFRIGRKFHSAHTSRGRSIPSLALKLTFVFGGKVGERLLIRVYHSGSTGASVGQTKSHGRLVCLSNKKTWMTTSMLQDYMTSSPPYSSRNVTKKMSVPGLCLFWTTLLATLSTLKSWQTTQI
jgi:hypothetical protein